MPDTQTEILTPAIPGYLIIAEIAKLADLSPKTVHHYRTKKAAQFPPADQRSGITPMWKVDTIIDWLASRPYAPTVIEKQPDGSLKIVKRTKSRVGPDPDRGE